MSELIDQGGNRTLVRMNFLATASTIALLAYVSANSVAKADDTDHPTVWIELGGQLQAMSNFEEAFSPPFVAGVTQKNLLSALDVQRLPSYALGTEGKLSFQPNGSDWGFSASVQYGRSSANRHRHQQTENAAFPVHFTVGTHHVNFGSYYPSHHVKFADGQSGQSESHLAVDFQAGRDVGLGILGKQGSSVLSAGVRIAQLASKRDVNLHAEPDVQYPAAPVTSFTGWRAFRAGPNPVHFHDYAVTAFDQRNFHGMGPELTWNASAAMLGDIEKGEVTLNWGLNGAVLFGRQTANERHKTVVKSYYLPRWLGEFQQAGSSKHPGYFYNSGSNRVGPIAHYTNQQSRNSSRMVTVPNLGAFAGLSYRIENFKVNAGYRADFFFGAMDGGIDTRKSETIGFHGPFATISIGLGG